MRWFILLLCLAVASLAMATDPLSAPYVPSMDTNCGHAQYASNIWMTNWNQKLRQDSGTNPGSACTLTIYGTQNEFVDFQVHFHDTGSGTSGLNITVGNFVQSSPGSYTISATTGAGESVIVYREAYMNVTGQVTGTANTLYGVQGYYPDILIPAVDPYWGQATNAWPFTVAAGNNQSAWVDVHIPSAALSGYYLASVVVQSGCPGSCTTLATMPVTIAVWQWPSAGNMPSTSTLKTEITGYNYLALCDTMYIGTAANWTATHVYGLGVQVGTANGYTQQVTIAGTSGSSQPSFNNTPGGTTPGDGGVTWTNEGQTCAAYPDSTTSDSANTQISLDASVMLKDHRYSNAGAIGVYPGTGSFTAYIALAGPELNGTCRHTGNTYCPLLTSSRGTTQAIEYSPSPSAGIWSNFQTNFDAQGWGTAGTAPLFDYSIDEPFSDSNYTTMYNNATTRHAYVTPAIPELVTTDIWWRKTNQSAADAYSTTICGTTTCLLNSVDWIVVPTTGLEPLGGALQPLSTYTNFVNGTNPSGAQRLFWSYTGCGATGTCTNGSVGGSTYTYPNYEVDGLPVSNRVTEWETFFHGQTGELYYNVDYCLRPANTTGSCGYGTFPEDPWVSIYAFGNWGDGTLIYPGSIVSGTNSYMGASVTTPIILPSLRLKLIRDGLQDYEYLYKLNALGFSTYLGTQIASVLTNSYTFDVTGANLQAARINIGNKMHQQSYPAGVNSVTLSGGITVSKGITVH